MKYKYTVTVVNVDDNNQPYDKSQGVTCVIQDINLFAMPLFKLQELLYNVFIGAKDKLDSLINPVNNKENLGYFNELSNDIKENPNQYFSPKQ